MKDKRRFTPGSAVFTCISCGKQTRDTGEDERQFELCKRCLFSSYRDNARSDYGEGSPQHLEWQAAVDKL